VSYEIPPEPKVFKGTVRELQEKLCESIESWTPEEKLALRRDTMRQLRGGKTAEGEWIS
jgi:hypothetical protein